MSDLYVYYLDELESLFKDEKVRHQTQVLSALTDLARHSSDFASAVSSKFAENGFSSVLSTFLDNVSKRNTTVPICSSSAVTCPVHVARSQLLVDIARCKFILNLNFATSSLLESSVLTTTLENLIHLSSQLPLLTCISPRSMSAFPALLEELSTPSPLHPSLQWREAIANDLLR